MPVNGESLGVLMLDLEGLEVSSFERELLTRPSIGGLILFDRNYRSSTQLQDLIAAVRECEANLLIAVDQEGGRVQRFQEEFVRLPALYKIGKKYPQDKAAACELARTCAWVMATELLAHGLDFSFAPVLDLYNANSQAIGERAFSDKIDVTTDLALAYIDGMHAAGMPATGKHFPGHGFVEADSHLEVPADSRSIEELREQDLKVFSNCIDSLDAVMPAHIRFPAVDEQCAGFSSVWLQDKLRGELDFGGVIFSDDLNMTAAFSAGSIEQRAEQALTAGCDMLLVCNDRENALIAADWLESQNYPPNPKLPMMRGKPPLVRQHLLKQDRWQEAKRQVEALCQGN
ncbi:MAG: beta-N-acetylhexosaminidase [Gammaproteobacteria bacterium]|nr:beta-N-acetylhexosaminidase [Gammaproteobacteria bacterium]